MTRRVRCSALGPVVMAAAMGSALSAHAAGPMVKAIFFYSPECGHCHEVIVDHMPSITDRFGDQLLVVYVDVTSVQGSNFFNDTMDHFGIGGDERAVPAVVVGNRLLVGSLDIPEQLPKITEAGLAAGGIDWPSFANLRQLGAQAERLATAEARTETAGGRRAAPTSSVPAAETALSPAATATMGAAAQGSGTAARELPPTAPRAAGPETAPTAAGGRGSPQETSARQDQGLATKPQATRSRADVPLVEVWARDPIGFALAMAVLCALVLSLLLVGGHWARSGVRLCSASGWRRWVVPGLCLAGLAVASYLGYVETTARQAVCGPVGDCNAVQQSAYAKLFGILPIGVLGILGYVAILALWAWQWRSSVARVRRFGFLLPAVVMFGVGFSAYLTFLEVFVIRAVCLWCLSSAVLMAALLWAVYLGWANRLAVPAGEPAP